MIVNVKATEVFEFINNSTKRYVINQGGTRSSKTYSFLQWLIIVYCHQHERKKIDIIRKLKASHEGAALDQFKEILWELNIPYEHNKSLDHFIVNNNLIRFTGMDQPQKKRGVERDLVLLNEANELTIEDLRQIKIRTMGSDESAPGRIFIDFNPSEKFWVHTDEIPKDNSEWMTSTYRNNPFLPQELIDEIERMKDIDPDFYRVYGLGELGIPKEVVYPYWSTVPEPRGKLLGRGLDFGFTNDPTALIDLWQDGDDIIIDQHIYRTGLTSPDIYNEVIGLGIDLKTLTIADNARPEMIEDLRRRGWRIVAVKKPKIQERIDLLKRYRIHVTQRSKDVIRELESYRFKTDKFGNMTNEPIDSNNHALDAAGYAGWHFLARPSTGKYLVGGVR